VNVADQATNRLTNKEQSLTTLVFWNYGQGSIQLQTEGSWKGRNDRPSPRIRWSCHRRGGRARVVLREWESSKKEHLDEGAYLESVVRAREVVGVQVGKVGTPFIRRAEVSLCPLS
jgi:hypothetical protein